jgi:hypothetical protein
MWAHGERQRCHERDRAGHQHRQRSRSGVLSGASPLSAHAVDRLEHLGIGEFDARGRREGGAARQGQLRAGLRHDGDRHHFLKPPRHRFELLIRTDDNDAARLP